MANWVLRGLRSGIRTTPYPSRDDGSRGTTPGRPCGRSCSEAEAEFLAGVCPTQAIEQRAGGVVVSHGRCVHCHRCDDGDVQLRWDGDYEWGAVNPDPHQVQAELESAFGRSIHIRFVDAGACGACMSEARQLNNPYYNLHRLGFFMTPTPRMADVLLVAGPLSDAMHLPLRKAYEAMPTPKRVVAIGACAITGGIFEPSFATVGGIASVVPIDVMVPGCPPPPLAILHGLLVVVKRKPPVPLQSTFVQHREEGHR